MDIALMLRTAVVLLTITAAGGLLMAGMRFTGRPRPPDWLAMLHGLLAWGLVTMLTFYLITTSIGSLISGATGVVGKGLSMAGQGIASVAPQVTDSIKGKLEEQGVDTTKIRQEAETLLRQTGKPELKPPQRLRRLWRLRLNPPQLQWRPPRPLSARRRPCSSSSPLRPPPEQQTTSI